MAKMKTSTILALSLGAAIVVVGGVALAMSSGPAAGGNALPPSPGPSGDFPFTFTQGHTYDVAITVPMAYAQANPFQVPANAVSVVQQALDAQFPGLTKVLGVTQTAVNSATIRIAYVGPTQSVTIPGHIFPAGTSIAPVDQGLTTGLSNSIVTIAPGHRYSVTMDSPGGLPAPAAAVLQAVSPPGVTIIGTPNKPTGATLNFEFDYTGSSTQVDLSALGAHLITIVDETPASNAVQVPGAYTVMTTANLEPTHTYLVSYTPTVITTLANIIAVLKAAGLVVNQSWDVGNVPVGWPSSDVDPAKARLSITWPAGNVPFPIGAPFAGTGVIVYATQNLLN